MRPAANSPKDTGLGQISPVFHRYTPCQSGLQDLLPAPDADDLDTFLAASQQRMRDTIEEYARTFTRPVILLTIQIAAGVFTLRWRAAGTQRFVQLTDPDVHALLLDDQSRLQRHVRIGHFEQQRLLLNHDYAVAFHLRKRHRMLDKALQANAASGLT